MNRRSLLILLLVGVAVTIVIFLRREPVPRVAWEWQLAEREYVHCLTTREESGRTILVAGIQQNNHGSHDYDNYIVCFDLATGEELWRRSETAVGNLRGGKRPTSIDFDGSGDLIVGWDYFAVSEGDYELVTKLSAKDGSIIWDWTARSEGNRSPGIGYSHGAWIFCDGSEVLVKTARSVGTVNGSSDMHDFYSTIDSSTGTSLPDSPTSPTAAEARWRARSNPLGFVAADGSDIAWGVHTYKHTETNWFRWRKVGIIWTPESHSERRERVQVTRILPHNPRTPEHFFVGREQERVISLLYRDVSSIPSAALLIDMSEEVESRPWRVVQVSNGRKIGRTLAHGSGISHNYDGPIALTESESVVISGSMLQDQNSQKIRVWK